MVGACAGAVIGLLLLVVVGIRLSLAEGGSTAALVAVWLWLLPVLGFAALCGRMAALSIAWVRRGLEER
jgi:hypothetical protein